MSVPFNRSSVERLPKVALFAYNPICITVSLTSQTLSNLLATESFLGQKKLINISLAFFETQRERECMQLVDTDISQLDKTSFRDCAGLNNCLYYFLLDHLVRSNHLTDSTWPNEYDRKIFISVIFNHSMNLRLFKISVIFLGISVMYNHSCSSV